MKNLTITSCPSGKVLSIQAKTRFDKVNGNSYFSARVTMCYRKKEYYFEMPFDYGYGDYYLQAALKELQSLRGVNQLFPPNCHQLPRHCRETGIILNHSNQKNCLKRELIKN